MLLRRKRVLAAKIETTIGTPIALSASDAAFNVFDTVFQPTAEAIERMGQGAFGRIPSSLAAVSGTVTFSLELTPNETTVPAWALTFLPACGLVNSSGTFTPRSEAPGSNVKTLTIGGYQNGLYKQIHGAMGNAVFRFIAGQRVMIDFTFTGPWSNPTDVAMITPTYPTIKPLKFISSGLLMGAYTPILRELTLDLGNEVVLREDSTTATGYISAIVTDRRVNGTMDPEAKLVATRDWYGIWRAETEEEVAFSLTNSDDVGVSFTMPKVQIVNIQEDDRDGIQIDRIDYQANKDGSTADSELEIAFDTTG